jgi:hypothetical protein
VEKTAEVGRNDTGGTYRKVGSQTVEGHEPQNGIVAEYS